MASDWFRHALAAAWSSAPLRRAHSAVVPTHSACASTSIIMRGWLVSPTAAMEAAPSVPTIMVSTEPITLSNAPSTVDGQAMLSVSLYSFFSWGVSIDLPS